jgi:autotransporter-associated beta strand protein
VNTGSGQLWVGQKNNSVAVSTGTGILNLTAGSVTAGNYAVIGRFKGNGTMNITGGTFTKNGSGGLILADGTGSIGLIDQTSGNGTVLVNSGELWIGQNGGVGTYNIGGNGSVVVNNYIAIGRIGGKGTLNMTGGTVTKAGGGDVSIGTGAVGLGTVNQSAGTFNTSTGRTLLGDSYTGNGTGNWNLSGSAVANLALLRIGNDAASQGTFSLNGGTLSVSKIDSTSTGATRVLNFNGGVLKPTANESAFMAGLSAANVQSGGAVIDTNSFNITIAQALLESGAGGLTKNGTGTLTLTGASTYSGATVVNGGKLSVTSNNTGAGSYSVADGKTLGVTPMEPDAQLTVSTLDLGSSSGASLDIDLGYLGSPTLAPIHVTGAATFSGITTINIATNAPTVGQFPLIKYGSKIGGSVLSDFVLTIPAGIAASLVINPANNSIDLNIIQIAAPRWDAKISDLWDTSTRNWVSLVDFSSVVYGNGQPVVFDDSVTGSTQGAVSLSGTVTPSSVTFDNSISIPYRLTGSGKISGTTGVLKKNDGLLIIDTADNDYTGVTRLEGGITSVALLANSGIASGIGKSSSAPSNLVLAGGTLSYTGPSVTVDRGYTVAANASGLVSGLDVPNAGTNLTLSGPAVVTSTGGLIRTGPGTITYTNATNQLTLGGVFDVQGGSTVFNVPFQSNNFDGPVWIGQGAGNTARVDFLNGAQFNTNIWIVVGREGGNGRLDVINSTLNHTVDNDLLLGSGADSIGLMNVAGTSTINDNWGWFKIGVDGGTGTYNQSGGSYIQAQSWSRLRVGDGANSIGTLNLSGGSFNVGGRAYVGVAGLGVANITGGAFTSGGDPHIGVENGNGTLALSNASTLTTSGWAFIGGNFDGSADPQSSVGLVTMADTSSWSMGGRLTVGRRLGNTGTLNLTGGTLTKTGTEYFYVADLGATGILNLSGSGEINVNGSNVVIGEASNSNGTVNQSGGTLNASVGEFWIGNTNGTGTYNLSGTGAIHVNSSFVIGRYNGNGTLNMSGGIITKAGPGNFEIGSFGGNSHTGTLNLSGGLIDVQEGILAMATGDVTSTGILNLDGGILRTRQISRLAGTANINFNGGTLVATADEPAFLTNSFSVDVQSGGAKFDSNGFEVGITQNLMGVGGLTKKGAGRLTLSGANAYVGTTTVEGGTLSLITPNLTDSSTLIIGTAPLASAILDLPNAGTDTVAALFINGVAQPNGIYDSTHSSGAITGVGKIQVGGASNYDTWIGSNFPSETDPLIISPVADPDGDGQSNALEFALGGVPNNGGSRTKIYSLIADSDADADGVKELLMTIAVRIGSPAFSGSPSPSSVMDGFTCTVEGTFNLNSFPAVAIPVGTVAPPAPNATPPADYEFRTFSLDGSNGLPTHGFLRVKVQ